MMKKVFNYFSSEDVRFLYLQFKKAAELAYEDSACEDHLRDLSMALEALLHLLALPGFYQELNKKADIELFAQLQILQKKAQGWKTLGQDISSIACLFLKYLAENVPNPKYKKLAIKEVEPRTLSSFFDRALQARSPVASCLLNKVMRILLQYGNTTGDPLAKLRQSEQYNMEIIAELVEKAQHPDCKVEEALEQLDVLFLMCTGSQKLMADCLRCGIMATLGGLLENSQLSKQQSQKVVNFIIFLVNGESSAAVLLGRQGCWLGLNQFLNKFLEAEEAVRLVERIVERVAEAREADEQEKARDEQAYLMEQTTKYLADSLLYQPAEVLQILFQLRLNCVLKTVAQDMLDQDYSSVVLALIEAQCAREPIPETGQFIVFKLFAILNHLLTLPGSRATEAAVELTPPLMAVFKKILAAPTPLLLSTSSKVISNLLRRQEVKKGLPKLLKKVNVTQLVAKQKQLHNNNSIKSNLTFIESALSNGPSAVGLKQDKEKEKKKTITVTVPAPAEEQRSSADFLFFVQELSKGEEAGFKERVDKTLLTRLQGYIKEVNVGQSRFNTALYDQSYASLVNEVRLDYVERRFLDPSEEEACNEIFNLLTKAFRLKALNKSHLSEEFIVELLAFCRVVDVRSLVHECLKVIQLLSTDEHWATVLKKLRCLDTMKIVLCKHVVHKSIQNQVGEIVFAVRGELSDREKLDFAELVRGAKGEEAVGAVLETALFLCATPDDERAVVKANLALVDQIKAKLDNKQLQLGLLIVVMRLCFQGQPTRQLMVSHAIVDSLLTVSKSGETSRICLETFARLFELGDELNYLGARKAKASGEAGRILLNLLQHLPINEHMLRFADIVVGNCSSQQQQEITMRLIANSQQVLRLNRAKWVPGSILHILCGSPDCEQEVWSSAERILRTLAEPTPDCYQLLRFLALFSSQSRNFQRIRKHQVLGTITRLVARLADTPLDQFYISPLLFDLLRCALEVLVNLLNDQSFIDSLVREDVPFVVRQFISKFGAEELEGPVSTAGIVGRSEPGLRVCEEVYKFLGDLFSRHSRSALYMSKVVAVDNPLVQLPVKVSDAFLMHHLVRIVRALEANYPADDTLPGFMEDEAQERFVRDRNKFKDINALLKEACATLYKGLQFEAQAPEVSLSKSPTLDSLLPVLRDCSKRPEDKAYLQVLDTLQGLLEKSKNSSFDIPSQYGRVLLDLLYRENVKTEVGQHYTVLCKTLAKCELQVQTNNEFYSLFESPGKTKLPGLLVLARTFLPRNRPFFEEFVWKYREEQPVEKDTLRCLEQITQSDKSVAQFFEKGLGRYSLGLLNSCSEKSEPELLRLLLKICTSCSKHSLYRAFYLQQRIHEQLSVLLQKFLKGSEVSSSIIYLLATLVHRNAEAVNQIASDRLLGLIGRCLAANASDSQVIESVSSFISNVTYKNDSVKIRIGNLGVVGTLMRVLEGLCGQLGRFRAQTFKQLLRALGNCSLILANAKEIVHMRYQSHMVRVLEHLQYKEEIETIKYTVDVLSNLLSHAEREFGNEIEVIYREGLLAVLFSLIEGHFLNTQVVASCLDAIDGLCQNETVAATVMERNIVPLIVGCVRSQSWSVVGCSPGHRAQGHAPHLQPLPQQEQHPAHPAVQRAHPHLQHPPQLQAHRGQARKGLQTYKILEKIHSEGCPRDSLVRSGFCEALVDSIRFVSGHAEYIQELLQMALANLKAGVFTDAHLRKLAAPVLTRMLQNDHRVDSIVPTGISLLNELQLRVSRLDPADYSAYSEFAQVFLSQKRLIGNKLYKERVRQLFQLYYEIISADPGMKAFLAATEFPQLTAEWKRIATALDLSGIKTATDLISTALDVRGSRVSLAASLSEAPVIPLKDCLQFFKKGVQFKMFRLDGSVKRGELLLSPDELSLMARKYPAGEFKAKYSLMLAELTQQRFNYVLGTKLWDISVFSKASYFASAPEPERCFTLRVDGQDSKEINGECDSADVKLTLENHLFSLLAHRSKDHP